MDIKLNERLRLLRNDKDLTQKELADMIHITEQTLNKYEKGHRVPDADCLNRMVNALECDDPGWLLTGRKSIQMTEEEFMAKWPEEIRNACRKLKDILLSDDPVIKPALLSNLAAFQQSLEQKEEVRKLNRRLQFLEERHKAKRRTGTDGAASLSTGKPET